MEIDRLLTELKADLQATFALVDSWFDQPASLRAYVPADQGWTIDEVLNHIGLTNHYLLILIEKSTAKALKNPHGVDLPAAVASKPKLRTIGRLGLERGQR